MPILQALETVAGALDNAIMGAALLDARNAIREGERIAEPLQRSKLFPLDGLANDYHRRGNRFARRHVDGTRGVLRVGSRCEMESLTAALEPIMIVFLGGIVGFIVVAMFSPLVALIDGLSGGGGGDSG